MKDFEVFSKCTTVVFSPWYLRTLWYKGLSKLDDLFEGVNYVFKLWDKLLLPAVIRSYVICHTA